MPTLAIVVPEYRTPEARGGGLVAVADFVANAFGGEHLPAEERWTIRIVSPRMFHRAPEHASAFRPGTLLRGAVARRRAGTHPEIWDVGTTFPEFEANRYRARRALTRLVDECDAAVVIAGTPAIGNAMRDVRVPWVLKVATLVEEERAARLAETAGPKGFLLRRATTATARLDRRALGLPRSVVTLNDSMAERLRALTDRPVHLLPTGVDVGRFHPAAQRAADGPIVMVSRLNDPRKDVATLLDAYALARAEHGVTNRLLLAGRHELPAEHVAHIGRLGLESHVDVVESPSDSALPELLRGGSVFALASREEGLGVVFLEAMATGLPIVTTATRGASYAVPPDAGSVVPFGEDLVQGFARALADAVHGVADSDIRGRIAREHVEAVFAHDVAEQRWRAMLEETIASDRGETAP